jgi:hypothetical protein
MALLNSWDLTSNIVAQWKMNEAAGNTVVSDSVTPVSGDLEISTTAVQSVAGVSATTTLGLDLNTVGIGQGVQVAATSNPLNNYPGTTSNTFAFWIRRTGIDPLANPGTQQIFTSDYALIPSRIINMTYKQLSTGVNGIEFRRGTFSDFLTFELPQVLNSWDFIVISRTRLDIPYASFSFKVYVNGYEVPLIDDEMTPFHLLYTNRNAAVADSFYIGGTHSTATQTRSPFVGEFDVIDFINRDITREEVWYLYNDSLGTEALSGNVNHLIIEGSPLTTGVEDLSCEYVPGYGNGLITIGENIYEIGVTGGVPFVLSGASPRTFDYVGDSVKLGGTETFVEIIYTGLTANATAYLFTISPVDFTAQIQAQELDLNNIDYYLALQGDTDLSSDIWYYSYNKKHAFIISSDYDAIDETQNKVIFPPAEINTNIIDSFSGRTDLIFNKTKIADSGSIEIEFEDRIITFIIDQSGSMSWNDVDGYRFEVASEIIRRIDDNYPGAGSKIKYNLVTYGYVFTNMLFFGIIDQPDFDYQDIDTLSSLYFADTGANFTGIRIVRNEDHYPNSPIDGEIVGEGFLTKVIDGSLETGMLYYYKVYTYDANYKFSTGVNISATPVLIDAPVGVTSFKSFIDDGFSSDNMREGQAISGSGILKDDNVIGLWHCDEEIGSSLYDFSSSGFNLSNIEDFEWLDSSIVVSGKSGILLNGDTTNVVEADSGEKLKIDLSDPNVQFSFMAWIYPYDINSSSIIFSRYTSDGYNYYIGVEGGKIVFNNGNQNISDGNVGSFYSSIVLEANTWQHLAIVYNTSSNPSYGNSLVFYYNGEEIGRQYIHGDDGSSGDGSSQNVSLGEGDPADSLSQKFYGKMSEISVHDIARSADYISNQIKLKTSTYYDSSTNANASESYYEGLRDDNGDRIVVLRYTVPYDYDFSGGVVRVVRKISNIPSWEEDGDIIYEQDISAPGVYYVVDSNDIVQGDEWYYRVFSKNAQGRFCYVSDASVVKINISLSVENQYWEEISPALPAPELSWNNITVMPGDKKNLIRWKNDYLSDDRIRRLKIFYDTSKYPSMNDAGHFDGTLIYTEVSNGEVVNNHFVHRNLRNDRQYFYTLVNTDEYGRSSLTYLTGVNVPASGADESTFPLVEMKNVHYDIVNSTSVNINWDMPPKNIQNLTGYFDSEIYLYALIRDQRGEAVPDDIIMDLKESVIIDRENVSEDVFGDTAVVAFEDEEAYDIVVSTDQVSGIIKASLNMTTNESILSQISKISFSIKAQSVVGESFSYFSQPVNIELINPWELELVNRDEKTIYERCYYFRGEHLYYSNYSYNGVYAGSSNPFVARAKLKYKGLPAEAGSVDASIWDSEIDLCSCSGPDQSCSYSGKKVQVSETATLSNQSLEILNGFETIKDWRGDEETVPISYVDIPLYSTQNRHAIILYVKGSRAGFSTVKNIYVVFQSPLVVDVTANTPIPDGSDVAEQQATAYLLNPDYPLDESYHTYPPDYTIIQWGITALKSEYTPRNLYSLDEVPLPNGVYSYLINGTARNVFLGPVQGGSPGISERYIISASLAYSGFSSTAKQQVSISVGGELEETIGSEYGIRFLMEPSYHFREVSSNRLWTDGQDYVKMFISRNPNTVSEVRDKRTWRFDEIFRSCLSAGGNPILELNNSGQIVFIETGSINCEILWGDISEEIDEYTGRKNLILGNDYYSESGGSAYIQLNDAYDSLDPDNTTKSDTTPFYIRYNSFGPSARSGCGGRYECEGYDINCGAFGLKDCDLPGGHIFVHGTTTLFVNGEAKLVYGGGSLETGVPPCPICLKESLQVRKVWVKVDGVQVTDEDYGENQELELSLSSDIEIRVEVLFSGQPVPDGTKIKVVIDSGSFSNLFIADLNTVLTITDVDGKSYADIRVFPSYSPESTARGKISIISDYNEIGTVERNVSVSENIFIEVAEIEDPIEDPDVVIPDPPAPPVEVEETSIYSAAMYEYDIERNIWSLAAPMQEARIDPFMTNIEDNFYVIGGLRDNRTNISNRVEFYRSSIEDWGDRSSMITPRYGGMTVPYGNDIYTIGGLYYSENNHIEVSASLEVYHTDSDTWETLSSMPIAFPGTYREFQYGVAYGTAQRVSIDGKEYIYILSGITRVNRDFNDNIFPWTYNDRILRYNINDNVWEYQENELLDYNNASLRLYQRLSPLSIVSDNNIIVFNGEYRTDSSRSFFNDRYFISIDKDINMSVVKEGGINFGVVPESKSYSSIVKYDDNPSSDTIEYYIVGGTNSYSDALDLVEHIVTLNTPFDYENSDGSIEAMPEGKGGAGAVCVNVIDEYRGYYKAIFVIGGYTGGVGLGHVDIEFDI